MSPGILAEIERLVRPEHRQRAVDLYLACGNLYVQDGVPLDPRTVESVAEGRGQDVAHCEDCGHPMRSHCDPYTSLPEKDGFCAREGCNCPRDDASVPHCDCGDAIGHGERGGPKP